jgi:spoIIIJ-associated protein
MIESVRSLARKSPAAYIAEATAMDKIEVSGRTIEEAIQAAAKELGVGTDAVEHEIVEEGAKGFLGLGQAPTLIRAWVREGVEAPARPAPAPVVEGPVAEEAPKAEEEVEEEPEPEPKPKEAVEAKAPQAPSEDDLEHFKATLLGMLDDVLGAMNVAAKPVVKSIEEGEVTIAIQGEDVAILIGRHGQTLDALQYLVSIAANRAAGTRFRVILDAEGYRDRYRDILEKKAREYATAVKAEGQEAELEPQSARDRRIIHMTLAEDPDVYTYSEGEGDNRHVVISPRK